MAPTELANALRAAMQRLAPRYGVAVPLGPEWRNAALLAAACAEALTPVYAEVARLNSRLRGQQYRRRRD